VPFSIQQSNHPNQPRTVTSLNRHLLYYLHRSSASAYLYTMAKPRKSKPVASRAKQSAATAPPVSQASSAIPSRAPSPTSEEDIEDEPPVKRQPFRFFDLPSELRLRIYEEFFCVTERHVQELYEGKARAANIPGLDERPDPPLDLGR
jgi:hypothetical protein